MVDFSNFIYGTSVCIHVPYKPIRFMAYIPNLVAIFVERTYLTMPYEVCIAVGCLLAHIYKNVGSLCPFSMLTS